MLCASCDSDLTDACAQCALCKRSYHFKCSGITKDGYSKLGTDRRAAWRCAGCKQRNQSPSASSSSSAGLDAVMKELAALRTQLSSLSGVADDVKNMRREMSEVNKNTDFMNSKFDELSKRLDAMARKCEAIDNIKTEVTSLADKVSLLQTDSRTQDQWSRINNVEIKGIPEKRGENVLEIVTMIAAAVKFPVSLSQIDYATRVASRESPKMKPIVVRFLNRHTKDNFIAAARVKKDLSTSDLGFKIESKRVFVNDHLTGENKQLLSKTKALTKEKGFLYCWVKHCRILVRKNDTSDSFRITSEKDLKKIQ